MWNYLRDPAYSLKRIRSLAATRRPLQKSINKLFEFFFRSRRFGRRAPGRLFSGLISRTPVKFHRWFFIPTKIFPSKQVRRYIRADLGYEMFFKILAEREIRYVVLRWFDTIGRDPTDDCDILIANEDLSKTADLFAAFPRRYPVDLYTERASEEGNFRGVAYYPPLLAKEILDHRTWLGKFFVPQPKDHLFSFAYHLIYHKAENSGLAYSNDDEPRFSRELAELRRLVEVIGESLPENFLDLHRFLNERGWAPPMDFLRKLSVRNFWLRSLLEAEAGVDQPGELMVYFVREWAIARKLLPEFREFFKSNGLEIVEEKLLRTSERQIAKEKIRGGDWGAGPYPQSGGEPVFAFILFDYEPVAPEPAVQLSNPFIHNAHFFLKEKLRKEVHSRIPFSEAANFLHSSDDESEAWEYIAQVFPQDLEKFKTEISRRRELYYSSAHRVLETLRSHRTRSRTEIIAWKSDRAIKKTFKLSSLRYLERELIAHQKFFLKSSLVSPLLATGPNYFIRPYYENLLEKMGVQERTRILKNHSETIMDFLKLVYSEGYALIDFNPSNLLLTPEGVLKFIDFEFLYRYTEAPTAFEQSYDLAGVPKNFSGDLPMGLRPEGYVQRRLWKGILSPQ